MMKNYKLILYSVVFILSLNTVYAQNTLSLNQAIEIGLKNNYSIQIANNNQSISTTNKEAAISTLLPKIDANAGINKSNVDTRQVFVTGITQERNNAKATQQTAGLQLSWVLFDGLKMFASYDRIQEMEKMGMVNAKAMVQGVLADIVINYYAIVASQEQLKISEDALAVSKKRLDIAQDKNEVGSGSTLDLLNAKVDYNTDLSSLIRQKESLRNLKIRLNELLILPVNDVVVLSDTIPTNQKINTDDLYQKMIAQNPSLLLAKSQQRIAELAVKEVSADRYPTLKLNSGYTYSNQNAEAGFFTENKAVGFNYGITASVNIFNGLLQSKKEKVAKIQAQSAVFSYEQAKQSVDANWNALLSSYQNNLELLQLEKENQLVAKRNIDISVEKFKLGGISSLQLREAQRAYIESNGRYINALYQYKLAETSLLELSASIIP
ncbi:MAG: TolC family protein [Sphingobacteriales bacterium]|nr:TolC family protein [Sphingobacteriales bacterium]